MSIPRAAAAAAPRYRPLRFGVTQARVRGGAGGVQYLNAEQALQPFAERMSDRLRHWAQATPEATFLAQRVRAADGQLGDWRRISYAQALDGARRIG
ncbi:MAG: feruloyl-CoA synthase, partial [Ottowia sp.]